MGYSLRDAASELVNHVTTDLQAAADKAVSRLTYDDLRHATAQYLMQNARDQWRATQAEREREATIKRVQDPVRQQKYQARRAQQEAEQEERSAKVFADMRQAMEDYERSIKVKWAEELLDAGFALPDGTLTTWGDASVEQHRVRIKMLNEQAKASTENAARHLKAVNTIAEAGTATLREAVLAVSSA